MYLMYLVYLIVLLYCCIVVLIVFDSSTLIGSISHDHIHTIHNIKDRVPDILVQVPVPFVSRALIELLKRS